MDVSGKRMMVVGLGRSGLSASRLLSERGARVIVNDSRDALALGPAAAEAKQLGAELVLGGHPAAAFESVDGIVVSPGVPALEPLRLAEARGVPVVSEIELASWYVQAPIIAITGTNGKSTVTSLIGEMCARLDRPVFVGGNLGRPMIEAVGTEAAGKDGLLVVELSSFQLERVQSFRAHIAILLNVSADHLDRYDSLEDYAQAKARIFECQTVEDFALLPAEEPSLRSLQRGRGQLSFFGGETGQVRVEGQELVDSESSLRVPLAALKLRGTHNLSNACAAAQAARLAGVPAQAIADVLATFEGLAHRMQYVLVREGVEYIDDSKATNVGAAVASIDGLGDSTGRVVLIAGGVDKGGSYQALRERMDARGRALVLLGEASSIIEQAFEGSTLPVRRARSMQDAVGQAASLAQPRDTVLLAPACSSFDMFGSYAERGDCFQDAVRALGGKR